jgi:tRNA threonylcarbamoyladenosine biosynthesis protein TsaB
MSIVLNIETATTVCSVALAKDGELLGLKELNNGYTHAENLTVFIEDIVREAGVRLSDIDAVAVSKGPGSYTGLRIGVAAAKGICFGLNRPLIAVDTLKSLTWQFVNSTPGIRYPALFCPMLDARRMEVYCALYDQQLNELESVQAKIIDENSFESYLKDHLIYFFGDGASKCREKLGLNSNAVFIERVCPSASAMISFSELACNLKQFEDIAYFEPYYLKDFVTASARLKAK